ncbi:MAG: Gfo/Idh/MocA family oxidoreductase [Planctomycetota bacterium]|nr:Gfo/Idh/MocA family oxidoreductase [Planctomycetota bacterium]
MAKRVRLALIGCGNNMRRSHIPRLKAIPGAELVAACDPFRANAEACIAEWGKPLNLYGDYKELLKREPLDGVLISTPHNQHFAQIRDALNAGVHVLVEKPLTISSAHSKALLALAKRKKRILHVSYQRHHMPVYRYVRDLLRSGKFGEVRGVVAFVTQGWGGKGKGNPKKIWRLDPKQSGGGMFMDTGSHLVAATLFLTGAQATEVSALVDFHGRFVDVNTAAAVRCKNGALLSLNTIGNAVRHDERLAIHTTAGSIVIHLHQWSVRSFLVNNEPTEPPKSYKPDTPDAAFVGWIQGKKGYEPPLYALEVARLTEAAYRSAERRRPVKTAR